jgi:hypothetical protein
LQIPFLLQFSKKGKIAGTVSSPDNIKMQVANFDAGDANLKNL